MHIAVCDDEENVRVYIRKLIEKQEGKFGRETFGKEKSGKEKFEKEKSGKTEFEIMEYASGEELLLRFQEADMPWIDILFLDIAMGDVGGMDVAKKLRLAQKKAGKAVWGSLPLIIFITGYANYMQEAFSVNAFQFLVKPIKEEDFETIFRQAMLEYSRLKKRGMKKEKKILIQNGASTQVVNTDDIFYIESSNHKVVLYLKENQITYYGKISELERKLQERFFRIHKGYLINLSYVESYERTCVTLKGGQKLAISKYKYQDFTKTFLQFLARDISVDRGAGKCIGGSLLTEEVFSIQRGGGNE